MPVGGGRSSRLVWCPIGTLSLTSLHRALGVGRTRRHTDILNLLKVGPKSPMTSGADNSGGNVFGGDPLDAPPRFALAKRRPDAR
jgi:hypothetical protein